jgi:hypothetical protein
MKQYKLFWDGDSWIAYNVATIGDALSRYICHNKDKELCAATAESFGYVLGGD